MADAKKCDRCGKLYTMDEFEETPGFAVTTLKSNWCIHLIRDLCPSCAKALEHFMKMEPIGITFEFHDNGFSLSNRYEVGCGGKHCHEHKE